MVYVIINFICDILVLSKEYKKLDDRSQKNKEISNEWGNVQEKIIDITRKIKNT